jgi:cell division protein FtsA
MPNNDRIIVGIDVGTHKICTIVAEGGLGGGLTILGVGAVASEGVSKGMITDLVKASGAIGQSLDAAERQSGCQILSAYVSISGNHISSTNTRGLVAVTNPERVIAQDDVARAVEAAKAMAIPAGRDILHAVPRQFTVDGQDGIRNPIGLTGFRLDVETHVVTGGSNVRENLIRCAQKADVEVDDLVLSPFAAAEAVLTEQERNLGVALVDIGQGTTDIAIYIEGEVWHSRVLPVGGWQITNDLAVVFNIPFEAAEALKLQYGEATVPAVVMGEASEYARIGASGTQVAASSPRSSQPPQGNQQNLTSSQQPVASSDVLETHTFEGSSMQIARGELNEVMAARLDQIFGLVGDEIKRSGYEGMLPAGVVLTGGVAQMRGIEGVASRKLRAPVRRGRPRQIGGLGDQFENPAYATGVGLILWGLKQGIQPLSRVPRASRVEDVAEERQGLLAKWLRMFLPRE